MRDDLLDAQAAVDWPVSQFPALQERIDSWLSLNVYVEIEETPPPATHDAIVAVEKDLLPRSLNVETGAYINTIRSSLDILASALATRYRIPEPDKVYFPVATSFSAFSTGNYKGAKFIKALPSAQRDIIEALQPYEGGNNLLYALHHLDIVRKHRRLIDVTVNPWRFSMTGFGDIEKDFVPVATDTGWLRANEKTVLGLLAKGPTRYDLKLSPYVAINESGPLHRVPVLGALRNFAGLADSIINLFDT